MNNKTLKIILIVILSILVVGLSIFFISIMTNKKINIGNISFGSNNVNDELVIDTEYETIFESINIKSDAGNIEVKQHNADKVKLVIYGYKKGTKVNNTDNLLDITSKAKNCIGFCFNKKISQVLVYLPKTYSGEITIENNYGDVTVDKFDDLTLNAKLNAGTIKTDSLTNGFIKNDYGDIEISGYSKKLEIEQAAGDIKVSTVDRIKAHNNYGNIEIEKVNEYLDVEEDCGDVKIDSINIKEDSKIENSLGDIKIGSTNEINIKADTSLGDTKINNNYSNSDITLTIENSCGDIKVNN